MKDTKNDIAAPAGINSPVFGANWDYTKPAHSGKWISFKNDKNAIVRTESTPKTKNGVTGYYWQYYNVYGHEATVERAKEQVVIQYLIDLNNHLTGKETQNTAF